MEAYRCVGFTPSGERQEKILWANDVTEARIRLCHSGWTILQIEPHRNQFTWRKTLWKQTDVIQFSYQMGMLLEAGLSLRDIVKLLADREEAGGPIPRLQEAIERGSALHQVLRETGFPYLGCALIEAGEQAGALGHTFLQVHRYYERKKQQNSQAQQALIYPAFVGVVLIVFLIVIMVFILPTFADVFASMGATLPWSAKILLDVGLQLRLHPFGFGLGALVMVMGMMYALQQERVRKYLDMWLWKRCHQRVWYAGYAYARFFSVLAVLLRSGMGLTEALALATPVWGNRYAIQRMEVVVQSLKTGISLAVAFQEATLGTPMVFELLAAGEVSGELETMLQQCATYFELETERTIKRGQQLLEPMLMSIVGIVVSGLVITLMVPLFEAVTSVGSM